MEIAIAHQTIPELFESTLRSKHYSVTATRKAVFSALRDTDAVSFHDLYEQVRKSSATNRASVYRTIALFEELGIVLRLQFGWKYKLELTDRFSHHHHHLTCRKCGASISVDPQPWLEQQIKELAYKNGFTKPSHHLEISGFCSDCSKTKRVPYTEVQDS